MPNLGEFLYALGDIGFYVAEAVIIAFVISYRFFFNWRKTAAGRAIWWTFVALGSLVSLGVMILIFGREYFGRELLRLVVAWSIAIATARLLWVLWSNWRNDKPPLELEVREHRNRETGSIPTNKEKS